MKKNQKILVAVLAIVIVLAVVIFAIVMNKDNTNETSSSSNVETSEVVSTEESTKVESSTEVIASIGTAPEDSTSSVDKSDAINFPGSETEASTSENNELISNTNTEVSTSESNTQTSNTKNETSESKTETSTSETSTSNSSTSKTETSTSETSTSTEPTTSESSTTTPVDNSSSSTPAPGEQIAQGSTGTTSLGTTYPIVSEFNKLGLNSNSSGWFSSDGMASSFSDAFGEGNKAIGEALGYRSNDTPIDVTNDYLAYLDAHITRKPESGYYVFVYAANITDTTDGGTSSRAAHQVMLGAITSTPVEVEQALFEDCFTDNEHFSLDTWVTVGDCQIRFVYSGDNGVEYAIRPKN